jgi:phospholipid/cholesterol/gamma-HCH transport system permease protein
MPDPRAHPVGGLALERAPGAIPVLRLDGDWTLAHVPALLAALPGVLRGVGTGALVVDATGLTALDTAGVQVLRQLRAGVESAGGQVEVTGLRDRWQALWTLVDGRMDQLEAIPPPVHQGMLEQVGRATWEAVDAALGLVAFIGESAVALGMQVRDPRRIRVRQTLKIIEQAGVSALPIVGLLTFLLGVVVAYQGGGQLKTYGANIFVVELVSLIMLRELAPLIAAIIVAGRTGSAYTAEIGTMRVTEEIDAMRTIGIGPFDQLVLPKVVGLMIALPLLTVFADAMGILGGMVMASQNLDVTFSDFLQRMPVAIRVSDFVVGVVKAPVFALIIAMVGCHRGFVVNGGADSVGRETTVSVVQSIFLVILSDAAFSILFNWMRV